jgi:hypothetical protein
VQPADVAEFPLHSMEEMLVDWGAQHHAASGNFWLAAAAAVSSTLALLSQCAASQHHATGRCVEKWFCTGLCMALQQTCLLCCQQMHDSCVGGACGCRMHSVAAGGNLSLAFLDKLQPLTASICTLLGFLVQYMFHCSHVSYSVTVAWGLVSADIYVLALLSDSGWLLEQ